MVAVIIITIEVGICIPATTDCKSMAKTTHTSHHCGWEQNTHSGDSIEKQIKKKNSKIDSGEMQQLLYM
jgi:hypothetical protein